VVDMSRAAVSARLRTVARLLEERGLTSKGVDMSSAAVTSRLQSMSALSDMCLRLGKATLADRSDERTRWRGDESGKSPGWR
jgi:hypothetical protein